VKNYNKKIEKVSHRELPLETITQTSQLQNNVTQEQHICCSSINRLFLLCCAMFLTFSLTLSARGKQQVELTAEGEKLFKSYSDELNALKEEIIKIAPVIDQKKKASFDMFHARISKIPKRPNPKKLKMAPVTYCAGYPPYASAQGNALLAARVILKDVDPFLRSTDMHIKLAKCSLLASGARKMAEFAQLGKEQKSCVDMLLNDDKLIVEVMELGGAEGNEYGQAMHIYKAIRKASVNANSKDFFRLWALASSLEHPKGRHIPEGKTASEAMVEFYLNYEKAFKDGELDPAFGTLPAWECRFIFDGRPLADAVWMRKMMRNYRPDHMRLDYQWRYCRITKSDVPYTSGVSHLYTSFAKKYNITHLQSFFLEGGICGARAFAGRNATHAFGIPSLQAPQTGHAAMAHWTPEGWVTVFGAHWTFNRAKGNGLNFELQSRSRRLPEQYRLFLRAYWLGDAFGETDLVLTKFGYGGGFWKALGHYKKLAIVEDAELKELGSVGAQFAESNVAAVSPNSDWTEEDTVIEAVNTVPQIVLTDIDTTITTDDKGIITIPIAACKTRESNEKVRFMKSYDDSFVQVHYSLAGNRPELLSYTVILPKAGKYEVTSRVVSVTTGRSFILRVNRRSMFNIDIPLSMGDWIDTKPVTIELKEGKNKLLFTIKSPNKGLSLKGFSLKPII
jgi:hypothetical protein